MSRPMFDSEYLYGLHDAGGEQLMLDAGAPGWVVISEEIDANPNDSGGGQYGHLSGRGLGVIVRLNYGYYNKGTIPHSSRYEDFAKRCANFVRNSAGCRIWIIGNEPNLANERPVSPAEVITPELYARCYRLCRQAIHGVDQQAQVLAAAVAPWNIETGDWIEYFKKVLQLVEGNCDGIALHTYGRSSDPATITSSETMDPPWQRYNKQFPTYKDFLRVVPASMRSLPCYITEADYNGPWEDRNTTWVRRAYEEINQWNQQPGNQVIRALVLYRWGEHDDYAIKPKNGAIADFKQALSAGFKWPLRPVADPLAALRQRLSDLETQVTKLLAELQKVIGAGPAASSTLLNTITTLTTRAGALSGADQDAAQLTSGIKAVEDLLALPPGAVPQPDMQDLRGRLTQTGPYPTRSLDTIRRVIVHHTAIADGNVSAQVIAQGQVSRSGRLGITYHFLINADGTIYWTQPLDAVVEQTLKPDVNADSVAVALGGNFMAAEPTDVQRASAAQVIAWLLATFKLGLDAVIGRLDVEKVGSPGAQWNSGARYRDKLLAEVDTLLKSQPPDDGDEIKRLRQRVDELAAQVAQLQGAAAQFQQETDALRATLAQKEQDLTGLRDTLTQREREIADARSALVQKDQEISALRAQIEKLQGGAPTPGPSKPDIKDPGPLKQHDSKRYPTRPLSDIKRIIVHHTATSDTVTPQRVAEAQVGQGRPGITYHFLISGDGTIYSTQPLETITEQTTQPALDANSVAVALAGNFTTVTPSAPQLASAAALIAWLLATYNLGNEALVGRSELERVGSPGAQWLDGARFKNTLLAAVQALLATAASDGGAGDNRALLASLQSQVNALTQERDGLRTTLTQTQAEMQRLRTAAAQVDDLQKQVQSLQGVIGAREATITQLQTSVAQLQAQIAELLGARPAGVPQPMMVNMIGKLETHPTLPPYATRTRPISLIAVHHTDTPLTHTVQNIAHYHVYGVRKNGDKILKEEWPGIAYHYIVAPDGVIYHCQPDDIRSYQVGGEPNNYAVAVSLIGRFMRTDLNGKPQTPEMQEPTPAQMASATQLIAWLMQKYSVPLQPQFESGIPVTGVVGHRDIWDQVQKGTTECPGDQWKTGNSWRNKLYSAVQAWLDGQPKSGAKPVKHYLLFWDHGADWAQADWRNAQAYIAFFRPTVGFAVTDAMQAEVVTIVGGEAGVTGADEARLKAAGCKVFRLAGANEADTQAKLAALMAAGTPYPGAATVTRGVETRDPWDRGVQASPDLPWDAWTVPDDWTEVSINEQTNQQTDQQMEDALIDIPGVTRSAPGAGERASDVAATPRKKKPARGSRQARGGAT